MERPTPRLRDTTARQRLESMCETGWLCARCFMTCGATQNITWAKLECDGRTTVRNAVLSTFGGIPQVVIFTVFDIGVTKTPSILLWCDHDSAKELAYASTATSLLESAGLACPTRRLFQPMSKGGYGISIVPMDSGAQSESARFHHLQARSKQA